MDYEPFKNDPNAKTLFMTDRGSTYALFDDQTTQRNRSAERHEDKTKGLQQRSGKTVFLDRDSMNVIGNTFQRDDMATKFLPVLDKDNKPTGKARLELTQDFVDKKFKVAGGKFIPQGEQLLKAGTVLKEVPYSTKPAVGMYPVEIMRSDSPIGDKGRGIHFGSKITEVIDRAVERAKEKVSSGRGPGGGGGMLPTDIEKVPGKRPLKMAQGGFVDKALERNTKFI